MRRIRRIGSLAAAGALLTVLVGGPSVSAQTSTTTPEVYSGSASGRALALSIGTQSLTAGTSAVSLDSSLKVTAQGTGIATPIFGQQTDKLEQVGNGVKSAPEKCLASTAALPAPVNSLLALGAACSSALASVENGVPKAAASGKILGADVNLSVLTQNELLAVPVSELTAILDTVFGEVGALEAELEAALGQQLGVTPTIQDVVNALIETKTLDVDLGTSTSETVVDGSKVTSNAVAEGGVIKLFPLGAVLESATGVEVAPIVEIIVGSAKASAVYDRAGGAATPSFDPAILTIKVNTPLTNNLGEVIGIDPKNLPIPAGLVPSDLGVLAPLDPVLSAVVTPCDDAPNEFCVLEGTPLETRIAVGSGRTVKNADGSVSAVADGVRIHALKNIAASGTALDAVTAPLAGGILLELAHAEAAVGGRPASTVTITPPAPAGPELTRELPRTGGVPTLALLAVGGLTLAFASRRTLVRVRGN